MVLNAATAQKADLSRWKVVVGGAPLSKGLARTARGFGIDILSGYGMSETCPVICVTRPKSHMMAWEEDRRLDILTKTGLPIPLVELKVVDVDDQELAHDGKSVGEVVMRAPWLTPSYLKEADKTRELWVNGWLHSGDVGHIDPEGYLTITDRLKDMIKSGGEWISSLDLENIMSQHPTVIESAAVGVPDPKWGERPLMLVVLKPEFKKEVGPEQLRAHMATAVTTGALPKYAVPERYLIVEEIPKTSVGKLDKKKIREIYA
jgi:fatty-acyl-CoA synthase